MQQIHSPWQGWQVNHRLGGGTFGTVYEIERNILGNIEKAAMKVIPVPTDPDEAKYYLNNGYDQKSLNTRYMQDLQSIAKEYTLMAALKGNANIVYCDDIIYESAPDGIGYILYIKMELLKPLNSVLTGTISQEQVIKVGTDLCAALSACKQHNIIHRDIKPNNILVAVDGNCKLGDFGIAKNAERTAGGTRTGTYGYMAPEVYNNQPYNASVDIYSVGVVLYWMLNNRVLPFLPQPPLVPTAGQYEEARIKQMSGTPIPAPLNGSPALKQVVLKACAFRPEDRYPSPEALAAALKNAANASAAPAPAPRATAAPTSASGSTGGGMKKMSSSSIPAPRSSASAGGGMKKMSSSSIPAPRNSASTGGGMKKMSSGSKTEAAYAPTAAVSSGSSKTSGTTSSDWGAVGQKTQGTQGNDWGGVGEKTQGTYGASQPISGGTVAVDATNPVGKKKPSGLDIHQTIKITPSQASSGYKMSVQLNGRTVTALIPPGAKNGQTIHLMGQGKQDPSTGVRGDAYLTIEIQKNPNDFWEEKKTVKPSFYMLITQKESEKGTQKTVNGRTYNIPAGTKSGAVIEDAIVYIKPDATKPQSKTTLRSLPSSVIKESILKESAFFAFLMSTLALTFIGGVLGILTGFFPFAPLGFGALGLINGISDASNISDNKKIAREVLAERKEL